MTDRWSLFRRLVALQLFIVLPASWGARVALDLRYFSEASSTRAVENEHAETCTPLHDHEACVQLLRSLWSHPRPPSASTSVLAWARVGIPLVDDERTHSHTPLRFARAPPAHL